MYNTTHLNISHPIFNDCEITLQYSGHVESADYDMGYLVTPAIYCISDIIIEYINDKTYSNRINKSMATFVMNNYEEELRDIIESEYAEIQLSQLSRS